MLEALPIMRHKVSKEIVIDMDVVIKRSFAVCVGPTQSMTTTTNIVM